VNAAVAVLFGVGAVVLWRSADDEEDVEEVADAHGFGAVAGQQLLRVMDLRLVRRIAAVIFAGLALWTAMEAIRD